MILAPRPIKLGFENGEEVAVVVKARHVIRDGALFEDPVFLFELRRDLFDPLFQLPIEADLPASHLLLANGKRGGHIQLVRRKRLQQKIVHPAFTKGLDDLLLGAIAGEDDGRDVGVLRVDPAKKLDVVNARHPEIRKDDVEPLLFEDAEHLFAARGHDGFITVHLEHFTDKEGLLLIIIHDQRPGRLFHFGFAFLVFLRE